MRGHFLLFGFCQFEEERLSAQNSRRQEFGVVTPHTGYSFGVIACLNRDPLGIRVNSARDVFSLPRLSQHP